MILITLIYSHDHDLDYIVDYNCDHLDYFDHNNYGHDFDHNDYDCGHDFDLMINLL